MNDSCSFVSRADLTFCSQVLNGSLVVCNGATSTVLEYGNIGDEKDGVGLVQLVLMLALRPRRLGMSLAPFVLA